MVMITPLNQSSSWLSWKKCSWQNHKISENVSIQRKTTSFWSLLRKISKKNKNFWRTFQLFIKRPILACAGSGYFSGNSKCDTKRMRFKKTDWLFISNHITWTLKSMLSILKSQQNFRCHLNFQRNFRYI